MLKKTIKYVDFAGNEREEDFYFNLTEAEVLEMDLVAKGGLDNMITYIIAADKNEDIVAVFKEIIHKAYGERSVDGRTFDKSPEILRNFINTKAYSELFMELATNENAAVKFVNGILPPELKQKNTKQPQDHKPKHNR